MVGGNFRPSSSFPFSAHDIETFDSEFEFVSIWHDPDLIRQVGIAE